MGTYIAQFFGDFWTATAMFASAISCAVLAYFFSRRFVPVLLAVLALLVVVAFLWYLPRNHDATSLISPEVPSLFHSYYWPLMLAELLTAVAGAWWLLRLWRGRGGAALGPAGASPELEAAWAEVVARLGWTRDRPERPNVCLLIGPEPGWAEALVEAAGGQVLASAPDAPGPIQAWALPEGVLLDATALSCFGTGSVAAVGQVEALGRLILAERPHFPLVRAVTVVFPAGWLARDPDAVARSAAALRDDIRALGRALKVHCPVIGVVPGVEALPGFEEFRNRVAARDGARDRRGFSFGAAEPYNRDRVEKGLRYLTLGVYETMLESMTERVVDAPGNARVFAFYRGLRGLIPGLEAALGAALTTARGGDPVRLHGCYIVGTGRNRTRPAFAEKLVRSSRGGLFSDLLTPLWSDQARADDRRYYNWAVAVSVVGASLAGLVWSFLLSDPAQSRWWVIVPLGLVALWAGVFGNLWLRSRSSTDAPAAAPSRAPA